MLFKVNVEYFDGSNVENYDYGYYDSIEMARGVADLIRENCFILIYIESKGLVKCPIANVTIDEMSGFNRPFMIGRFSNED